MSTTTTRLCRATIAALAPVVLLGAFLWHPPIPGRLPNDAAIAAAVVADPTGWGLAHLAAGVASAFVVLAFIAVRSYLREAGGERWSALGLPLIVVASTLYALLPGMEFAPLAAFETGGDVQAAQAALAPWFVPTLIASTLTFALGVLAFAKGVAGSRALPPGLAWLVVAGLVVMAATRLVPLAAVQFYAQSVAAIVALWPLAYVMWTHPQRQPTSSHSTLPAGRQT
jgi:hypothetical protein